MAVKSRVKSTDLVLVVSTGIGDDGRPKLKRNTYKYVKETATNESVHEVALAIASLSNNELQEVGRSTVTELSN
jgi:hypothetical protein